MAIELLEKKSRAGVLLLLPSFIIYCMFLLYPIFRTIYNSFFHYTLTEFTFVGFDNYIQLFTDNIFIQSFKNTLIFVVFSTPAVLVIAFLLAVAISGMKKKTLYLGMFYLPAVCSGVSIFLTWQAIYKYDGILNMITGLEINWLGNPYIAIYALVAVLIYISIGQPLILFVAAIENIPEEYYESADIEGINWLQRIRYITLPLIKPTILYVMVIRTIGAFNVFVIIQMLTGGGPFYRTSTIAFQLYKTAFDFNQFGLASTMGSILLFVVVGLTVIQWKFLKTDMEY